MAAVIERDKLEGEPFERAIQIASKFFKVPSLYDKQKHILREFFLGKSIIFSAGTVVRDMTSP